MQYRFDLQGQRFGTMVFKCQSEAQECLKRLLGDSEERFKRAKAAGRPRWRRLKDLNEYLARHLRVVPTSTPANYEAAVLTAPPSRHSSRLRQYGEIA